MTETDLGAPLVASRLETNIQRLLSCCETLVSDKKAGSSWRLEKYLDVLQEKISELKKSPGKPSAEIIQDYTKRIEFLKGLNLAEKLPSPSDKAAATQLLPVTRTLEESSNLTSHQLHHQASSKYLGEMRQQLLGRNSSTETEGEGGLKHRRPATGGGQGGDSPSGGDLDVVLQHQHRQQEKLAQEMLHLARSLKHNTMAASHIIKEDVKVLQESSKMAETNYGRLKTETERLEAHTKRSCNWWVWIVVITVFITFFFMIIFIRIFPKRS